MGFGSLVGHGRQCRARWCGPLARRDRCGDRHHRRGAGRDECPWRAPPSPHRNSICGPKPGMWAPIVGQLWQGEQLVLLAGPTPDDWYNVQTGDQTGWAYGGLLALDGAGDALSQAPSGAAGGAERWVDVDRTTQMVTLYEGTAR